MAQFTTQSAADYDSRILHLVPGYEALQSLVPPVLESLLPAEATLLVAGAGTGAELVSLARCGTGWLFTAVDPSAAMLDIAGQRMAAIGAGPRVRFHAVPLADYAPDRLHDAAVSLLVSHFLPDDGAKDAYFKALGRCLRTQAPLVVADLAVWDGPLRLSCYRRWATAAGQSEAQAEEMFGRIAHNFHPVGQGRLTEILEASGFTPPQLFFQALDYRGYVAWRR